MKLRNKKTGEIWDIGKVLSNDYPCWETLAQLCEDWEDYKPAEPYIKDKKVRKFVRDWAEAFSVKKVYVYGIGDGKEYIELYAQDDGVTDGRIRISIPTQNGVWIGKEYTITELCGEEEES